MVAIVTSTYSYYKKLIDYINPKLFGKLVIQVSSIEYLTATLYVF